MQVGCADATSSFWKDSQDLVYPSLSRSMYVCTYVCLCSQSQSSKLVGIVPIQRDFRVALLLILSSFSDFDSPLLGFSVGRDFGGQFIRNAELASPFDMEFEMTWIAQTRTQNSSVPVLLFQSCCSAVVVVAYCRWYSIGIIDIGQISSSPFALIASSNSVQPWAIRQPSNGPCERVRERVKLASDIRNRDRACQMAIRLVCHVFFALPCLVIEIIYRWYGNSGKITRYYSLA